MGIQHKTPYVQVEITNLDGKARRVLYIQTTRGLVDSLIDSFCNGKTELVGYDALDINNQLSRRKTYGVATGRNAIVTIVAAGIAHGYGLCA